VGNIGTYFSLDRLGFSFPFSSVFNFSLPRHTESKSFSSLIDKSLFLLTSLATSLSLEFRKISLSNQPLPKANLITLRIAESSLLTVAIFTGLLRLLEFVVKLHRLYSTEFSVEIVFILRFPRNSSRGFNCVANDSYEQRPEFFLP